MKRKFYCCNHVFAVLMLLMYWSMLKTFAVKAQSNDLPIKHFSHPDRISYDSDCFTIEGKDIFIYSAAFHYFRCPEPLWKDRFKKIKEAGFNTVETYVPWNWHERNMPRDINDYSQCDFSDLRRWLKMAHEEFGLYTIVRPGPFICAEWAGGAYPRWLAKYCPETYSASFWLRSDDPEHVKWSRHWFKAVSKVFAPEQLSRKKKGEKGIIMVQLENEYVYFGMSSEGKIRFMREIYDESVKNGIDVPFITCVTPEVRGSKDSVISQVFDMDNQYVWWNMHEAKTRIEDLKRVQPNAPAMVCELQGGWFSTVGGGLSEDSYLDGRHARGMALMAMAGGATGLNYYMFFGGTHFAGWGARRMTTTYDYGAPLKENGGVGEKYDAVKGVGDFIAKYNSSLARAKQLKSETKNASTELVSSISEAPDGTRFVYLLNKSRDKSIDGKAEITTSVGEKYLVEYSLTPYDSRVLVYAKGSKTAEVYPKSPLPIVRPQQLPQPIRIATAQFTSERYDGKWRPLKQQISLPEIGVNDCRYSLYRSSFTLTKEELVKYGTLICDMFTADPLYVEVNGNLASRSSIDELDNTFIINNLLREGENKIVMIYENRGHAHGYKPMEELSGLKRAGLGGSLASIQPVEEWQVKLITNEKEWRNEADDKKEWEKILLNRETIDGLATIQIAGLAKPKWPAAWILQGKNGNAIYRASISFTPEMIADGLTVLEFGCIDDEGTLFVNGKQVGSHNKWDEPFVVNIAPFINSGDNRVELLVKNGSGAGGMTKGVRLMKQLSIDKELIWEVSTDLGGVVQGWTKTGFKPKGWKTMTLDTTSEIKRKGNNIQPKGMHDALMTWYYVEFELPEKGVGEWIPWRAVMNASGTGYMWLNGQNIGRHWEEGPQREFYLPECWLNFGKGRRNILVFGLRQSDKYGAKLNSIEIRPYEQDAEMK